MNSSAHRAICEILSTPNDEWAYSSDRENGKWTRVSDEVKAGRKIRQIIEATSTVFDSQPHKVSAVVQVILKERSNGNVILYRLEYYPGFRNIAPETETLARLY